MKLRKAKKGFTIVELVIVIGVIGILTGILIPTFVNVTQKAEEAALKSNLANAYSAYVADAADGKVESAQKIFTANGTEVNANATDTYYVDLIKQEEIVLIGGTGNKDAGKQYKFNLDKSEWQEITVSGNQIALENTQLMLAYNDSDYSKYNATGAADHYFRIQYGTYLVYGTVNRAA